MSSQRAKVASGTIANATQMALGFATIILFSRLLGSEAIGIYFFVLSIVATSDGILTGVISACGKRIPEEGSKVAELLGILAYGVIPVTLLYSIGVAGVLLVAGAADARTSLFVFIVFVPFVASSAGVRAIIGFERVDVARWLQTARTVVRVLIQFILIIGGMGVIGMILGHAIAMSLAGIAAFMWMKVIPRLPSRDTVESVWEFARYSVPSGLVSRVDESADEMLMGLLFAAGAVGEYGVAVRLVAPALLLPSVIQGSLSARLSRLESEGREVDNVLRSNLAFSAALSIPIFFGALAIGDHVIVTVFSSEFAGAAAFLTILAASRVIKSWSSPMTSAIAGLDRPRTLFVVDVLSATTMVLGGLLLSLAIGPIGIALGILIAVTVRWVSGLVVLLEYAQLRDLIPAQIFEQIAAGIAMYGIIVWVESWFITDWIAVILTVGLGGVVYGLTLLSLSAETRSLAFAMANRIKA